MIWIIQDRIALDADEEKAVELKRERVAGQEGRCGIPPYPFPPRSSSSPIRWSPASGRRSRRDSYGANADRRWLEPLVDGLFSATAAVGSKDGGSGAARLRRKLLRIAGREVDFRSLRSGYRQYWCALPGQQNHEQARPAARMPPERGGLLAQGPMRCDSSWLLPRTG